MITAIVSVVTFLAGLLLGHRFALGRDRRKEFNAAALPIRGWILRQQGRPEPHEDKPDELELDTFASCLRQCDRVRFEAALSDYRREAVRSGYTGVGILLFEDEAAYRAAVDRLLPFTSRR